MCMNSFDLTALTHHSNIPQHVTAVLSVSAMIIKYNEKKIIIQLNAYELYYMYVDAWKGGNVRTLGGSAVG